MRAAEPPADEPGADDAGVTGSGLSSPVAVDCFRRGEPVPADSGPTRDSNILMRSDARAGVPPPPRRGLRGLVTEAPEPAFDPWLPFVAGREIPDSEVGAAMSSGGASFSFSRGLNERVRGVGEPEREMPRPWRPSVERGRTVGREDCAEACELPVGLDPTGERGGVESESGEMLLRVRVGEASGTGLLGEPGGRLNDGFANASIVANTSL